MKKLKYRIVKVIDGNNNNVYYRVLRLDKFMFVPMWVHLRGATTDIKIYSSLSMARFAAEENAKDIRDSEAAYQKYLRSRKVQIEIVEEIEL